MQIVLRELKANFKSLIIWIVIVLLFTTIGFAKFSAYEGNPEMLAILDGMPPAILEAFNMNAFNLTTVTGFYGVMSSYFMLIVSIAAVMWGSDVISKEERDKTAEFFLSLPVSRARMITAKIIAMLINCLILSAVMWASMYLNVKAYQPDQAFYDFLAISMQALVFIQLVFLSIGIMLGCVMRQHKRSSSVAVSVLLASYFLSIFASMTKDLKFLKYFSPFSYFDSGLLFREGQFGPVYLALSAGIILVATAAGYFIYTRRDIYI